MPMWGMPAKVCSRDATANAARATAPPPAASWLFASTTSIVAPKPARNEGAPIVTTTAIVARCGRSRFRPTRYGRRRWTKKNHMLRPVERDCPQTVASAAPRTPMSRPRTSSGSSAICVRIPTTHSKVENAIRPSARTSAEKPVAENAPSSRTTA